MFKIADSTIQIEFARNFGDACTILVVRELNNDIVLP